MHKFHHFLKPNFVRSNFMAYCLLLMISGWFILPWNIGILAVGGFNNRKPWDKKLAELDYNRIGCILAVAKQIGGTVSMYNKVSYRKSQTRNWVLNSHIGLKTGTQSGILTTWMVTEETLENIGLSHNKTFDVMFKWRLATRQWWLRHCYGAKQVITENTPMKFIHAYIIPQRVTCSWRAFANYHEIQFVSTHKTWCISFIQYFRSPSI